MKLRTTPGHMLLGNVPGGGGGTNPPLDPGGGVGPSDPTLPVPTICMVTDGPNQVYLDKWETFRDTFWCSLDPGSLPNWDGILTRDGVNLCTYDAPSVASRFGGGYLMDVATIRITAGVSWDLSLWCINLGLGSGIKVWSGHKYTGRNALGWYVRNGVESTATAIPGSLEVKGL